MGGEGERPGTAGVEQPETRPGEREEVHRVGDDIREERVEVERSTDLRREPAQGVGAAERVVDDGRARAVRLSASQPRIEVGPPDEWLVAAR